MKPTEDLFLWVKSSQFPLLFLRALVLLEKLMKNVGLLKNANILFPGPLTFWALRFYCHLYIQGLPDRVPENFTG